MTAPRPRTATAEEVLAVVRELATELHPRRAPPPVTLDTALERELGFDSLGRMELLARLERDLGVAIPVQTFASIETPRDLLRAARLATPPAPAIEPAVPHPPSAGVATEPLEATTLPAILDWHAQRQPDSPHIHVLGDSGELVITFGDLRAQALAAAHTLLVHDIAPGEPVAIMLPTCREYFAAFYGVLYAGGVPVPIYPPARARQLEEHVRRHARILANARTRILIAPPEARAVTRLLRAAGGVAHVITSDELIGTQRAVAAHPRAQDIALLQYTSGSTGQPKGVILTHANLLANIRVMGRAVGASPQDVFVSWLPLYHDMGLIGAWLGSLYYGIPLAILSPLEFLARPISWLRAIQRFGATFSAAPNFAYELCLRRLTDSDLKGVDLSSLRWLFNGAEPVSPRTLRNFSARFAPYGLRPEALAPVYGLAECALGLAFPRAGHGPRIDSVRREPFMRDARAEPAGAADAHALEFVSCGKVLPGYAVRIVDADGNPLGEREEGVLEFTGPSATSGYYRNAEATRALFHDDWLDSGDRAYLADGDIFITGRVKDVIIRAGRNIYPTEIEEAVGNLTGIRKGCVAVFGSPGDNGTERLIVLAETREESAAARSALRARINDMVRELAGDVAEDVVLAEPHTVLKTSSGKIRRAASRELYERGALGAPPALLWQLLHVIRLTLAPQLRRASNRVRAALYAGWAWSVFLLLAPFVWLLVSLPANPRWGRPIARASARLGLALVGLKPHVTQEEPFPSSACIFVANHASYLDGIILTAVLPTRARFIAKREFLTNWPLRAFLNGIGSEFVERFTLDRSVEDAARMTTSARAGSTLTFFPEGTFVRRAGLLPFRLGAFRAAADAGVPIVPLALRGSRLALPDQSWRPRHARIDIVFGPAIAPHGPGFDEAVRLRDAARNHILAHCGEPALG